MNTLKTAEKTYSFDYLIEGLKDKTITLLEEGHLTNSLIEQLEYLNTSTKGSIEDYKSKIAKGILKDNGVECEGMIKFCEYRNKIKIGRYVPDLEINCFNCDARLYLIFLSEKTLGYVNPTEYWELAEKSGDKLNYIFKKEDIKPCACKHLSDQKMLVSEIDVPTGEIIFKNYFQTEKLYTIPSSKEKRTINSVLGRNELMQYLATENVGYGQMGNMSVSIYSNKKDEILVCGSYIEDKVLDLEHCIKNEDGYWKPEAVEKMKLELPLIKKQIDELKKQKFKKIGDNISLSVWRWMCIDKKFYDENKETKGEYEDLVSLKVNPGKYRIEHYYDFFTDETASIIYSRLKLIK